MTIVARPYDLQQGDPDRLILVIETFVENPAFATYPWPADVRRASAVQTLTNPQNLVFEAWKDGVFCGILLLERIIPYVDAQFHFLFTDHVLVDKRKLLVNFLGTCFREMGFHRLSAEVPDGSKMEKFYRQTLGFRYEGEGRQEAIQFPAKQDRDRWQAVSSKHSTHLARQGSRRTQMSYDGETWRDIMCLRLLASEWEARHTP